MIDTLSALAVLAHRGMEWLIVPFLVLCLSYTWFSAKPPVPAPKPDATSSAKKSVERKKPSTTAKVFRVAAYVIATTYSIIVITTWLTTITLLDSDQVLAVVRSLSIIAAHALATVLTLAVMRKYVRITRQVNRVITGSLLAIVMIGLGLPAPILANLIAGGSTAVTSHTIVALMSLSAFLAGVSLICIVSILKRKSRS